jgi:hypothetical protein
MDTLSDPLDILVLLAVSYIDGFKPGSDRFEKGVKVGAAVKFAEFLFVMVRQPAASINPTDRNTANGTSNFIGGSVTRSLILI